MKKRVSGVLLLSLLAILILSGSAAAAQMTKPALGAAQAKTFDIEATTAAASTCKYSSPFSKPYAEMTAFTATGGTTHTLPNFEVPTFNTDYDFYINCNGAETTQVKVRADDTNPSITEAKATPAAIVQAPLQTALSAKTNEDTFCKYDETKESYAEMAGTFGGSETDKSGYTKEHSKTITGLQDQTGYNYKVKCRDLSGRESPLAAIAVSANTQAPAEITKLSPSTNTYTTESTVILAIETNKNSLCKYGNESGKINRQDGTFNIQTTKHEATLQLAPPEERTHTYYISCIFEGPSQLDTQTTFTIDKTPPTLKFVNDTQELKNVLEQYTYYIDRLKVKFDAEDKESGIKQYNYSVLLDGNAIYNGTTTSSDTTIRDLELQDGKRYVIRAVAENNAGLLSTAKESNGITVDVSLNLAEACRNGKKDNDEADIDCGGSCEKKCSLKMDCRTNNDCGAGYCLNGQCNKASCSDEVKNQDETDIDCGGKNCKKCSEGNKCTAASDCATGICTEGLCLSKGPCYNSIKDATETDIDCGGLCAELKNLKCIQGRKCSKDTDCTSGTCGVNSKCAPKDDADYDMIITSNDNCPKAANPRQEDLDSDGIGDVCDDDSDGDGMSDEYENANGLNPRDASDAKIDSDEDGLTNLQESKIGTSAQNRDSDGDGVPDGTEVQKKTNPLDAKSKPGRNRIGIFLFWMLIFLAVFVISAYIYIRKTTEPAKEQRKKLEAEKARDLTPPTQRNEYREYHPQMEPRIEEERKYRPKPLYTPLPPQKRAHHALGNPDLIREEHARLSGEEVFERLKRHTRGRRHH